MNITRRNLTLAGIGLATAAALTATLPARASDATDAYKKFNSAHNAPFMLATHLNGFLGFSVPMNANGYAEKIAPIPTGYGYQMAEALPGSSSFGAPGLVATVPDLGPGVVMDQLTVLVYDACAAGAGRSLVRERLSALRAALP